MQITDFPITCGHFHMSYKMRKNIKINQNINVKLLLNPQEIFSEKLITSIVYTIKHFSKNKDSRSRI